MQFCIHPTNTSIQKIMTSLNFKKIAVIGAGTMGSGIAGQIANAGHSVLLLDLPRDDDANGAGKAAISRLLKSEPPALMHKNRADLIAVGNMRDDFQRLAEYDWVIEAVVERLDIKQALYKRLHAVIKPACVVTSNTSTIPLKLLVENMPADFRARFAITHYFNPVRYMRLLELVQGAETRRDIIDKLAEYNDVELGKGVVVCRDTPGFLGNRVGVYALQVGIDEAYKQGLDIETADALMGRPMGIPKTGVFGLYDLIGLDLMADVVDTLGTILPEDDVFHQVGAAGPSKTLLAEMIAAGYSGEKGLGGFYRSPAAADNQAADNPAADNPAGDKPAEGNKQAGDAQLTLAIDLVTGKPRPRHKTLPLKAQLAAENQALNREALLDLLLNTDGDAAGAQQTQFCRNVLARVLAYAASLIPAVTASPQAIDDAMKLGFNWVRGPFEMMDVIGKPSLAAMITDAEEAIPSVLQGDGNALFYAPSPQGLQVRQFSAEHPQGKLEAVSLPDKVIRFNMTRRCLTPLASNLSASLFALDGDLRLLEFHSKANALTRDSMEIVQAAAQDHGRGIIIHNDAQHFSAGVDLNAVLAMIRRADWAGIDQFLIYFQQAVSALKYAPVPVVAAPSGLAIGGGFEVIAHADKVIAHGNCVLGLVEAAVGLVPSGGGVKETFYRWQQHTGDWSKAAWNTWMQMGFARTGSSPEQSARLRYFLPERDQMLMNRDRLVSAAIDSIEQLAADYIPPAAPIFTLPDKTILGDMEAFMDKGINDGRFFAHDKTVAMHIAYIIVNHDGEGARTVSEADLFARERDSFIKLAKTAATKQRIAGLLEDGRSIRN